MNEIINKKKEEQIKKQINSDYLCLIKSYLSKFEKIRCNFKIVIKNLSNLIKTCNNTSFSLQINNEIKLSESTINEIDSEISVYSKTHIECLCENDLNKTKNHFLDLMVKFNINLENATKRQNDLTKQYDQYLQELKEKEAIAEEKKKQEQLKLIKAEAAAKIAALNAAKKAQEDKEAAIAEEKKKKAEMAAKKTQALHDNDKQGINTRTFERYEKYRVIFEKIRKETEDCFSISNLKLYKFDLQRAINFPLNSLLDDNTDEQNKRIFYERVKTLIKLFSGQTCAITTTLTVNPTKHPKAIEFCLLYLAKKIVEKGEVHKIRKNSISYQLFY
jgi:hypothetical protein